MDTERPRSGAHDADTELAMLEFEDGRVALYDPSNPAAWLLLDPA